jgi:hypothetical protein
MPLGLLLLQLEACSYYVPRVTLEESPQTIPARVQLHPLVNASIAESQRSPQAGDGAITNPAYLDEPLADLVTTAILKDFRKNGVFDAIGRNTSSPDLVLQGEIHRFQERVRSPRWLAIPLVNLLVMLFAAPVESHAVDVELELMLAYPDGTPLGQYRGQSQFTQNISVYDPEVWNAEGHRLNLAFTEAVRQIREQMLADEKLMKASWRDATHRIPAPEPPPGGMR